MGKTGHPDEKKITRKTKRAALPQCAQFSNMKKKHLKIFQQQHNANEKNEK